MQKVMLLVNKVTINRLLPSTQRLSRFTLTISRRCLTVVLLMISWANSAWLFRTTQLRFKSTLRTLTPIIIKVFHWIGGATLMRLLSALLQQFRLNLERLTSITIGDLPIVNSATLMPPLLTIAERSNLTRITSRHIIIELSAGIRPIIWLKRRKTISKPFNYSRITYKRSIIWER